MERAILHAATEGASIAGTARSHSASLGKERPLQREELSSFFSWQALHREWESSCILAAASRSPHDCPTICMLRWHSVAEHVPNRIGVELQTRWKYYQDLRSDELANHQRIHENQSFPWRGFAADTYQLLLRCQIGLAQSLMSIPTGRVLP